MTANELMPGAMYRAKHPQKIQTIFREVLDDRFIIWINSDWTALQYTGPGVAKEIKQQTTTVEKFLQWASHQVTMSEDT